jgi:hypothetical protein
MEANEKYIAICKWVENGRVEWDAITNIVTKDEAIKAIENVIWDGPNMNQSFSFIEEKVYLEMLKIEENV